MIEIILVYTFRLSEDTNVLPDCITIEVIAQSLYLAEKKLKKIDYPIRYKFPKLLGIRELI